MELKVATEVEDANLNRKNEALKFCLRTSHNVGVMLINDSDLIKWAGKGQRVGVSLGQLVTLLELCGSESVAALAPKSTSHAVNYRQKSLLVERLEKAFESQGSLAGKTIALWGLAFKANTDDMRESPSLPLIDSLLEAGATVVAHDPAAMHETERRLGDRIAYAKTSYDALSGADALVVVTDWNEYRFPDFSRIRTALRSPVVVDGRNLYDPEKMRALGFTYRSIGRGRE